MLSVKVKLPAISTFPLATIIVSNFMTEISLISKSLIANQCPTSSESSTIVISINSSSYNEKQELANLKKEFAKFQLEQTILQNKAVNQSNSTNDSQVKPSLPWKLLYS